MSKTVERIRRFNRFYTNIIGVLDKHILESPFSLSEARVLYELNTMDECTARDIMQRISIDEGYLSRIIEKFIEQGLVKKARSEKDKRAYMLHMTAKGKAQFQKINEASASAISDLIKHLTEKEQHQLINLMEGIETILTKQS
jgi:DNA-binding MarR family transcriptional regulator